MSKKPIIAIMYDFDKTLCTTDMQNYSFIPNLGLTPTQFWGKCGELVAKYQIEKILSYMYLMIKESKEKGIKLTRQYLNSLGKDIVYYKGVETWFKRINEIGEKNGFLIEHYLVSSGTKEIIEGSKIAHEFKAIYGCEFMYDDHTQEAIWPKIAINYTAKTQFFFRISKGILDITDDDRLNEKTIGRRILYSHIIYIGDGMTDIPCMLLAKQNGGKAIAVYQDGKKEQVHKLFDDGRVNFVCPADYSRNGELEKKVRLCIEQMALQIIINEKEAKLNMKN